MMEGVTIDVLSVEHYPTGLGIHHERPRLSWRFKGSSAGWKQQSYTIEVSFEGSEPQSFTEHSSGSVLVPWPAQPFKSRQAAEVRVKATGIDGSCTGWSSLRIEAALLDARDWKAAVLAGEQQAADQPKRPQYLSKRFSVSSDKRRGRLYATALGCYEIYLNGEKVGNEALAPGWQSYKHRHYYQTHDISSLLKAGENHLVAVVGEGWYATRLNFGGGQRNIWGADIGAMLQLEVDGSIVAATDTSSDWQWAYGPILSSEIYDGEVYDSRIPNPIFPTSYDDITWSSSVRDLGKPKGQLLAAECPPVRVTQQIKPKELITTPSGKKIFEFGENIVGWVQLSSEPPTKEAGSEIILRHAEVLEHQELGTRPLRQARAQVKLISGGTLSDYHPSFTFHGFRYCQVDGWEDVNLDSIVAQVIHTDMERTGWFESSHPLINQLHANVVRSLRGNFVSVPTDCPQRDERLGWTGDLQVFATTASFLYDTSSTLSGWLQDLAAEQLNDFNSVVPLVVPDTLGSMFPPPPSAIWGDVAVLTPSDLFDAYGDAAILERQYESMQAWLDKGIKRGASGLWDDQLMQFGDWLDPKAPPDAPQDGRTDNILVSDAYLVHTINKMHQICRALGKKDEAARYQAQHAQLREAFQKEYITANGRLMSDSQTAIALSLQFGLLPEHHVQSARQRLERLVRKAIFQVSTGFAGTPIILHALSDAGLLQIAYRMLQEGENPSWLYPVKMGATTIVSCQLIAASCRSHAELIR
jgi:alpha-L-rhamnosidase